MSISINGTNGLTFNDGSSQQTAWVPGMRNRIINGAMMIDQRNAGASVTPTSSAYTVDRWQAVVTQSSKFSVQQNAGSVTPPVGFSNYIGVTSLSAYSVLSSDVFAIRQFIEGYNIADLNWGTANAAAVTLSFKVYSSLTGTFGGTVSGYSNTYCYPFSYSIPVANTWTTVSVTIPGATSTVWNTTNSGGITVTFGLGVGSTGSGAAGSWSSNNYYSATGATSVVGTNGATFYITGVQLEKGSTATSFDYRPYGTELALCQRYYWKSLVLVSATANTISYTIPVPMRATPTINTTPSSGSGAAFTVLATAGNQSIYQSSVNSGATSAIIDTSGAEL